MRLGVIARLRGEVLVLLLTATGCRGTLSPLSNRIEVGQEPYIVFVADGEDQLGDLFASAPTGGQTFQITFTRLDERAPALSPDGTQVAFLRGRAPGDTSAPLVIFFNLLNGAERRFDPGIAVTAVAWAPTGRALYLRTSEGVRSTLAPPAAPRVTPVLAAESMVADSAFRILLGDPAMGEAVPCDSGGVCARLPGGTQVLAAAAHDAARWGSDSVLYVEKGELVVRPLGGGGTRIIRFAGPIRNPRGVTRFGGVAR